MHDPRARRLSSSLRFSSLASRWGTKMWLKAMCFTAAQTTLSIDRDWLAAQQNKQRLVDRQGRENYKQTTDDQYNAQHDVNRHSFHHTLPAQTTSGQADGPKGVSNVLVMRLT
jgi:phosphoglucomutase